jgi:hypothetical protein
MQVIIRGTEEIIARLDTTALRLAMNATLRETSLRMVRELARYPSPPSGSTYRRTGTLGRGWQTANAMLRHVVGNNVRYATYVQGPEQAWMHRGRWQTADEVAQGNVMQIASDIAEVVARQLGG